MYTILQSHNAMCYSIDCIITVDSTTVSDDAKFRFPLSFQSTQSHPPAQWLTLCVEGVVRRLPFAESFFFGCEGKFTKWIVCFLGQKPPVHSPSQTTVHSLPSIGEFSLKNVTKFASVAL